MIRVNIFSKKNLTKTTQKVEDMATEFLLTFLAVLVQLGLPVRQQQGLSGKESESRFAIYRLAALSWVQRVGCASLASCMLSLSLSSAQESGPMSGLAYCAGLAVYQGALNPARALGPAVVANRYFLRDLVTTHLSLFSSPLYLTKGGGCIGSSGWGRA